MKSLSRATLVAIAAATIVSVSAPMASAAPRSESITGSDRYGTAYNVAGYQDYRDGIDVDEYTSDAMVIVGGDDKNLVDSVTAAGLAGALDARLLLTARDSLPAITAQYLNNHKGVSRIVIVGGTSSVSAAVQARLGEYIAAGATVERIAGEDRYATAAAVADTPELRGSNKAFIVNGSSERLADAVSVGSVAGFLAAPILLTKPDGELPATMLVKTFNRSNFVIGGTSAVSQNTVTSTSATRIAGDTRYATSLALANYAVDTFGMDSKRIVIAEGYHLIDALSASVINRPVVLSTPKQFQPELNAFLDARNTEVTVSVGGFAPRS